MSDLKTKPTNKSVAGHLSGIANDTRREDARTVLRLMKRLGKHKTSVSCLYLNKLSDIDLKVLEQLVGRPFEDMKRACKA